MERVKCSFRVFDNYLEIIPQDGMKDNSIYEIKIKGLKQEMGHKTLDKLNLKFCTKLKPAYTTIPAVQSLIENCNIEEHTILYHIREASKYADYIKTCKDNKFKNPHLDRQVDAFQTEQFTRYKAAYECLLRFYMDNAAQVGVKGTLGDVSFETPSIPDITPLLSTLKDEVEKWSLALQGHTELRTGVYTAVKGAVAGSYAKRATGTQIPGPERSYIS